MSDKPAEQAYHARGAGREVNFEDWWKQFEPHSIRASLKEACRAAFIAALREPGADTGTTPPIEELISKWSNELVYSLDEAEIDLIEKIAPLILRDMAAAERGTTPPEGMVTLAECPPGMFIFEGTFGFKSEYVEHESMPDASLEAFCADSGEYFWGGTNTRKERDALMVQPVEGIRAATQRAPVEQERGEVRCDNCGEDTELDQCPKCGNGLKARREKLRGAPDHAREGALFLCRYRDSEGKECGAPIALNVDSYSGFIHTEGSGWLHWASPVRYGPQDSKAVFVKRADGKEGPL